MERRTLVALLLSGLVLIVWFAVFPPPRPTPPAGTSASPTGAPEAVATTAAPTAVPAAAPTPVAAAERAAQAIEIPLEGGRWRAVVDSAGATVRSLTLAGYNDDEGAPLEMVAPGTGGLLALAATGPWNQEPYVVERMEGGVALRWSDGRGNWVEKRIAVAPGPYGLLVEVSAGGAPAAGGVLVGDGGLGGAKAAARRALGGAVVRVDGSLERLNPAKLNGGRELRGRVEFAGVEDQYFLVVLLPEGGLDEVRVDSRAEGERRIATVVAQAADGRVRGTLYAGPKDHDVLTGLGRGLDQTLSFGLFGFLSVAFLAVLRWIHSWSANWGVAIIVLTAAIRLVLFPLTHKSTVAMKRMQTLQPKMKAIQERYQERAKKDPQVRARMNQELMQLYKQEKVNPMGGCLPIVAQMPILFALYTLFANAIELRHAPFMLWIHDLSLKDPTYITPILMTASMVLQQRLSPQVGDPAQRRMFMLMPFIFGLMFMSFPAGLVLYWLVNNLLTIGQQLATDRLLRANPATT
jgi:YidC/Oxa1 family membrane protein insertase